jgi:hypothetical protein
MTTTPHPTEHPTEHPPTHPGPAHAARDRAIDPALDRRPETGRGGWRGAPADPADSTTDLRVTPTRRTVVAEQRRRFGGFKWGAAFFGWLTATGSAVLLTVVALAVGAAAGITPNPDATGRALDAAGRAAQDPGSAAPLGATAAVAMLVVLFLAYVSGGYVAGRMARFNGAKQGFAVWVWSVLAALVVVALELIAVNRIGAGALDGLPQLPVATLTPGGIAVAVVAIAVALVGALLGGMAGMRYHRRVDRAGLDA